MSPAAIPLADLTEKAWTAQLVELARTLGYKRYHTHDSRRSAHGFPDEVLVRDRVVFAELKRELTGRRSEDRNREPTDEQRVWLDKLAHAGGEVYLWRPSDLEEIGLVLSKRSRRELYTPGSLWIPGVGRADTQPLV